MVGSNPSVCSWFAQRSMICALDGRSDTGSASASACRDLRECLSADSDLLPWYRSLRGFPSPPRP